MAELTCVDGTVLSVLPDPCLDRDGTPFEVTLRLLRDGRELGAVGERCGFFLAATAARLRAAGPGRFPAGSVEGGLRAWAADEELDPDAAWASLSRYLPRERELFAFRSRDPDDLSVAGELRAGLREERSWEQQDGSGRWRVRCRAVVEAWGAAGIGVRAVLDSAALQEFLDRLLAECAAVVGASYDGVGEVTGLRRPAG